MRPRTETVESGSYTMNLLDIRTIFVSYSISNAICAIVMAFLWLQNRRRFPELSFWLANFILQFLAVVLITLRGIIPDFISIVVANTLGVTGIILLFMGLEKFVHKVSPQRHNYILLVAFFIAHTYFTYVQPSLMARNHNVSLALFLVCVQAAWLMIFRVDARFQPRTYKLGLIFVVFGLINLARILLSLMLPRNNDLFQSDLFESLVILAFQMLYIGLSFKLFILVNHRLIADLEDDIIERKKVEQALYENYSTLHNIMESSNAMIFSVNQRYCFTSFNSSFAAKMKQHYGQDIQLGGSLLEYIGVDEDRMIAKRSLECAMAGKHLLEEILTGEDTGSPSCFEVSHAPILTDSGETIGVSVFSKEITERKRMELSLKQRLMELETVNRLSNSLRAGKNLAELLQLLLKETVDAVTTAHGCILLLDPVDSTLKMAASRGWFDAMPNLSISSSEGIVGHVFATNEPSIAHDMQNEFINSNQTLSLAPLELSGALLPIRGENSTIGVLIASFQLPRVISGNELRLLAIIAQMAGNAISRCRLHDQVTASNLDLQNEIQQKGAIQELLAAEKELFSTTLMSIADGVIVTDKDGLIILFNQAAESITGYTVLEATKASVNCVFRLHHIITLELVPDVINYLFELEEAQKRSVGYRSPQIMTKSGERILIAGSITSLRSAHHDTAGFVIVFQNINEKQRAEAQNLLSQKMEAIGQLAAGIAHEINTPIQYVGDNVKFLGRAYSKYSETLAVYQQILHERLGKPITQDDMDQLDDLARQKKLSYYLNEIPKAIQESLDGTERVRKIVLAMREFSHPSGKEKRFSDINHGIETTIVISRNEWKYCAEMETDLDTNLPLVYCQIDEINQVVLNMIVNAAQAIQEKTAQGSEQKGRILIGTGQCEDKVIITVQDTGSGIPPEIRARIFDPFFTTKGVGKGTGQGLSMAHNIIVKKHHGVIGVDSNPSQGTTFTIELPIESTEVE
jgi:PAS domain S-box-containing protein